jgi:cytochrome d ubiquinol oxidase subunit II
VIAVVFLAATKFATGLWNNYFENPLLLVIPLVAVAGLLATRLFLAQAGCWKAWFASCVTIVGCTLFGVVGLYPTMLPSTLNPEYSITAFNSASSPLTLKIMLVVALIFVPIVIAYQTWVFVLFKDKVTKEDLAHQAY